jgi:hypothetical protein
MAIIGMALSIFLATCQKDQKSQEKIEKVTYSKNFNNNLTDANEWFDVIFTFHNAANSQEIADKKQLVESFYEDFLVSGEKQKHEVYFKWVNINTQPLQYRVTSYVTPQPTSAGIQAGGDPPLIPPPPPPYP